MKIRVISEIIWCRCTGVHFDKTNQVNQPTTPTITRIISASASEISPPSVKAPLATAHINPATGSKAAKPSA